MSMLRDSWRAIFFVAAILLSTFALFSLTMGNQFPIGEDNSAANFQFGFQLDGGIHIHVSLAGIIAEDVELEGNLERVVERQIAVQIAGADATDTVVHMGTESSMAEATIENVTADDLSATLGTAGYAHGEVKDGVAGTTRAEMARVLQSRISEAGLSNGTVQQVTTATGEHFILVEAPNRDQSDAVDLVGERGAVQINIYCPTGADNGSRTYEIHEAVSTQADLTPIGTAQESQTGSGMSILASVRDDPATEFQTAIQDTDPVRPGGTRCTYVEDGGRNTTEGYFLLVINGEVVGTFGMSGGPTDTAWANKWAGAPSLQFQTRSTSEAQEIAISFRAGALSARLDLPSEDSGISSYISPSQGRNFKFDLLITGIVVVLVVAGVVFICYGRPQVALPMIVTGLSEVYTLLGFIMVIGYPFDLSVITGFIVVVGTGVDDPIIIADEVISEGSVKSRKVFQSRFRRAFRVIGAVAATTIIAVNSLAMLSLGDLQGLAIFTILGATAGMLATRSAYDDIFRPLLTKDR